MDAAVGYGGRLGAVIERRPRPVRWVRIPGMGRVMVTRDEGSGAIIGRDHLQTRLTAVHLDNEQKIKGVHDLGSGNVQSNFVMALMQDQQGTATNLAAPLLAVGNKYMYSGTGGTVNTYDYKLVTPSNNATAAITPTRGFVANGTAGSDGTLTYVGTTNYTSSLAITEWGMTNTATALTSATNLTSSLYSASSFSSVTASVVTPTANPSWTTNLYAGCVFVDTSAATTVAATILSNTGTSATVAGWYKLASAGGSGTTPGVSDTLQIWPLLIDHKTFSALNVINGDSIQWTYTLQLVSGG